MYPLRNTALALIAFVAAVFLPGVAIADQKPNIVLVFMDNFGWGEPGFNGGGIIRGAPTPRLDELASEGLRLTNFNVEAQCTPSRSAIMTGRYAIRSGNGTVPVGGGVYGLVQWEVTLAEMLFSETRSYEIPRVYNLLSDPQERENVLFPHTWVPKAALGQLAEHIQSLRANPPIRPGTRDPYEPPK